MSINVTVNGNPVCTRRRVVLSDLEQIKKNERERRRRLRLEQVRQQSKEMSSKLLDRAKNIAKKTLNDIENDKDSEFRRMHDKKIMEIQQKYQEDMEDIGLAHASAAAQPDVQIILENERLKNQLAAAERGKEASQRLKDSAMQEDSVIKQQERLRQVREVENVRSSMIANLSKCSPSKPKRPSPAHTSVPQPSSASIMPPTSADTAEPMQRSPALGRTSSKKRKHKKIISIKSPPKVISKSNMKIVSHPSKPTQRVVVEIHREDSPPDRPLRHPERSKYSKLAKSPSRVKKINKINQLDEIEKIDETHHHYNPTDYQQNPSSSTSSLSVSDDSSYFSDGAIIHELIAPERPRSKHQQSAKSISPSKVHLYDYNTRQRDVYNRPAGVVERINLMDEPNAVELARKTSTLQSKDSTSIESQRARAQQRGTNAALRQRVKKDYQNLIEKLDHLSREEQKLKASQTLCHRSIINNKKQRQQKKDMKQAEMNRVFEASRSDPIERIITINSEGDRDNSQSDSPYDSVYERSDNSPVEDTRPEEPSTSRNEQILDMLKKVERQKQLLLQEFGASLPDSILNASMTRLFDNQRSSEQSQEQKSTGQSPEITIIKVPESIKKPQKMETAVQTSHTSSPEIQIVNDKSIQVELIDTSSMRADRTSEPLEYVEPIVRIIHPEVVASSSSDSSGRGFVIDFSKQKVKVTPTKRKTPRRKKNPKSLPTSGTTSPVKRIPEISKVSDSASASAPISRVSSPQEAMEEVKLNKYKLPERKKIPIADTSTDVSFGQPSRQREHRKSYVKVKQTILKKYYNNTSDTSTSYASLPAVQPGSSYPEAISSNMTPILQMLDSSANESILRRFRERNISPVSTPETPSPSILRIPSNIPDVERLGRVLRYDEGDATHEGADARRRMNKSRERERERETESERATNSSRDTLSDENGDEEICRCKNPICKLVHQDLVEVNEDYGASNKPETIKKYDELQNICAERIASLNAIIKQVRDERQEDYSLTAPSDDTSLMQMPTPRPRDNLHSVQKLVDSIEAIHCQLAKTLQESQKIITGLDGSRRLESPKLHELPSPTSKKSLQQLKSPNLPRSLQVPQLEVKNKPKVISEETVKINLQRFKSSIPKKEAQPSTSSAKHDDIVEKLSLEILEQTKSSEKAASPKKKPDSPIKREKPKEPSPIRKQPQENFIPLLAGIPKVPKTLPSVGQGNGRRRPPPVIHPTAYGIEALSPPHELSTIAEFDTPDTGNRSQMSARSPTTKSRRQLSLSTAKQEKIAEESDVHEVEIKQSSAEEDKAAQEEANKKNNSNDSAKSTDSAGAKHVQIDMHQSNKLITSSSSTNSFSGLSGISEILSTPTSDVAIWAASPPERMEDHLRKLGLGWAIPVLRKTREAGALSSSSSSDITLLATMRKTKSPIKKNGSSTPLSGLPDFSDVSSISIREASKSTERAVLMKARTSTPNIQNSNYSTDKSTSNNYSTSGISRDNSDSINLSPKKR